MTDVKNEASFMSVKDIARDLKVSLMTVYREIHSGQLPAIRINRVFRVERAAYEAYRRKTQYTPPGPPPGE